MKNTRPRVLLLGKRNISQQESKKVANFKWIEVDDGYILNIDRIIVFHAVNDFQENYYLKFELTNDSFKKTFESQQTRDDFLIALKEKLDVLV